MKIRYAIVAATLATTSLPSSASAQNLYDCDDCSRFIEIDRLKARCFIKRFEKQNLLGKFKDETITAIPVNFKCGLISRDVVSGIKKTENDPNSHMMTKSAIKCLYKLVKQEAETFTPARLISFEKHCQNG